MAGQKVTIEMDAKSAALVQAWQEAKRGPKEFQEELDKVKQRGKDTTDKLVDGFKGVLGTVLGITSAAGAMQAAFGLARKELEAVINRQERAANFQISLAGGKRAALQNLGIGADLTPAQLSNTVGNIASSTGADLNATFQAASGVLSARGKFSASEALNQLRAVARINPSLGSEQMQSVAGASLDIRKAFGGSAEQAVGGMMASMQTARVEDIGSFAQGIVPALLNLKEFGTPFRESSALTATISQMSGDVTGRRSGTAAIRFAQQLEQATATVPEMKGAGTTQRIDYLLSGDANAERIRQDLLGALDESALSAGVTEKGQLTTEAKQFKAITGLLTPGSEARKAYEAALAGTPTIEGGDKVYAGILQGQAEMGLGAAQISEAGRGASQALLSDATLGATGASRETVAQAISDSGGGWFATKRAGWQFNLKTGRGQSPESSAIDILQARRADLDWQLSLGRSARAGGGGDFNESQLVGNKEILEKLIEKLDAIEKNTADKEVKVVENLPAAQANRAVPQPAPMAPLNQGN